MRLVTMPNLTKISRCTNNARIPIICLGKRSDWRIAMIIVAVRNFPFHFKPVKKYRATIEIKTVYPGNSPDHNYCINHYSKKSQRQSMTPNKLQNFHHSVQSMLQFMNSSNLHRSQQFYLIKYRVAQILLKMCKFTGVNLSAFKYIGQNHNTILNDKE